MVDMNTVVLLERCRALLASGEPPPPHTLRAVAELLASSGAAPRNSAGPLVTSSSADGAPGTSLQFSSRPDPRMERALQRHASRAERPPPIDIRAQKVRQYQDLLSGEGGKYVHADYKLDGGTQIGNYVSMTPSMYANFDSPAMFSVATTALGKGAPQQPQKKSVSSGRAFRVA
jgi:hypothetical protein|eukprot:jgi/Chrpa1/23139/Chrysochromulina_OHIO_Genome00001298-RA